MPDYEKMHFEWLNKVKNALVTLEESLEKSGEIFIETNELSAAKNEVVIYPQRKT